MLARQAKCTPAQLGHPVGVALRPRCAPRAIAVTSFSIENVEQSLRSAIAVSHSVALPPVTSLNPVLESAAYTADSTAALGATVIFGLAMLAAYAAYTIQDKSLGRWGPDPAKPPPPTPPADLAPPPPPEQATPAQAAASAASGIQSGAIDVSEEEPAGAAPAMVAAAAQERKADARDWIRRFTERSTKTELSAETASFAQPAASKPPSAATSSRAAQSQKDAAAAAVVAAASGSTAAAASSVEKEMADTEAAMKAEGNKDGKGPLAALLAWLKSVWAAIKAMLGGGSGGAGAGTPTAA